MKFGLNTAQIYAQYLGCWIGLRRWFLGQSYNEGGNQTFATTAKATYQIGKADVQVLASQNWDAALHDKVSYAQISNFVPIYFKTDQVNLCSNAVHSRCRSQQLNQ